MRYSFVHATVGRCVKWVAAQTMEHGEMPSLTDIFDWMRDCEEYHRPLVQMPYLLRGLRDGGHHSIVCHIAIQLCSQMEEDAAFIDKAGSFFDACASRFKIDDFDVRMHAGHKFTATLHDQQPNPQ